MSKQKWLLFTGLAAMTASSSVLAHGGVHEGGFAAGLWHLLSNVDHLLAMLAVGVCAAVLRRRLGSVRTPVGKEDKSHANP